MAFSELKSGLTTAPILALPDFSKPFVILCYASVSVYLKCNGVEHRIAYANNEHTNI